MELKQWWIDKPRNVVWGYIYGNPGFYDGEFVHTSPIEYVDIKNMVVKTKNSTYKLGVPSMQMVTDALMAFHTKED